MPITYLDAAPRKVRFFEPVEPVSADPTDTMTEAQVEHVAEIFNMLPVALLASHPLSDT